MQLLTLKTVLAAVDLDGSSRAALTSARDLASASGAALHVLHVRQASDQADSLEQELQHAGIARGDARMHTGGGDPAHAITLTADKVHADVIVLGPYRERPDRARSPGLGSTALAVVTNASVPCLVATRSLKLPLDQVVVATDLSDTALGTLHVALSWASALRAQKPREVELTALNVMMQGPRSQAQIAERIGAIEQVLAPIRNEAGVWAGLSLRTDVIIADAPAEAIAAYAAKKSADLVALGTRGLGLDPIGRLGSVSVEIMRRVDAPVLLVPPAMWTERADERSNAIA